MRYYSTNQKSPAVSFREAVLKGQPADRGLYFPERIPSLSKDFFVNIESQSKAEIAFRVIAPFIDGEIDDETLYSICEETVDFEFPLIQCTERISALELFHGPTLAFKDVGARFMSRCLKRFVENKPEKTLVVVATSGDTGGAVANGFFGVEGVEVVILYPKGKVSEVQEQQLTTLGGNVSAIEIDGNFDDCQDLAKSALTDEELAKSVFITSANSINVARWLPQQFYYFFAYQQWQRKDVVPVVCVPSGNFGNVCAGVLANVSGLPIDRFIAATNANDIIPRFLQTGTMIETSSVVTLSNAMDVANPSNFVRIMELFENKFTTVRDRLLAFSVSDEETVETIQRVYDETGYILDPHGAVAFYALKSFLDIHPRRLGYFLETAHPIKFTSVCEIISAEVPMPDSVKALETKEKLKIEMNADYDELKEFLIARAS